MNPGRFSWAAAIFLCAAFGITASAQLTHKPPQYDYSGEYPVLIEEPAHVFDFVRREEMIPMRDGVKLFTIILIP